MTSFSPISFSPLSFTIQPTPGAGGKPKKRNKFRDFFNRLGRDFKRIFYPPLPETEIPPEQPRLTTTIIDKPPETVAEAAQLETLNDKWKMPDIPKPVLVSKAAAESAILHISEPPPVIIQPSAQPLKQTVPHMEAYKVAEGEHIESQIIPLPRPKPKINSRSAAILIDLMILSQLEELV